MGAIFRKLFKIFRRFIQLLFSRMIIVALLIILQIIWIWLVFEALAEYNTIIQICTAVLGVILVLVVVNKDEVPEYKMPWLLVIVISPILGGVLFIFFGSNQPGRRMKREYMRLEREAGRVICQNEKTLAALEEKDAVAAAQAKYIYESSRSPVYDGTHTQYFPMGEDMFPAMVRELKKAEKFVFLEYFIIEEGRFLNTILEILQRKMQEGVEVRIMYDDIGSIGKVRMGYARKLRKMGFNAQVFRPFLPFISTVHNNRDHRKIMVIDNRVAFTGGINLADEYINEKLRFGTWKDTGIMVEGDCVAEFTCMFLTLWDLQARQLSDYPKYAEYHPVSAENADKSDTETAGAAAAQTMIAAEQTATEGATGEAVQTDSCAVAAADVRAPLPSLRERGYVACFGDGPAPFYEEQVGKNIYLNILNNATDYVYISTPYLVCDNELLSAIRLAARRGVDVRLITPHIPDKKVVYLITRSSYSSLMEAGVKIYEYTPGFIHAKNFLSDDKYAVVSTINLDYRSLVHHFECGVWMYDTPTVAKIKGDFLRTLADSREVPAEEAELNLAQNIVKSLVQVITPLL